MAIRTGVKARPIIETSLPEFVEEGIQDLIDNTTDVGDLAIIQTMVAHIDNLENVIVSFNANFPRETQVVLMKNNEELKMEIENLKRKLNKGA